MKVNLMHGSDQGQAVVKEMRKEAEKIEAEKSKDEFTSAEEE